MNREYTVDCDEHGRMIYDTSRSIWVCVLCTCHLPQETVVRIITSTPGTDLVPIYVT